MNTGNCKRPATRRLAAVGVALAIATALVSCSSSSSGSGSGSGAAGAPSTGAAGDIKIGAILSQTGPVAALGSTEAKTLTTFVDRYNKAGGYEGHKIQLKVVDDQSDPAHAVDVTRAMISSFHPNAIIGASTTATCYAMEPITRAAKTLQYCISGAPLAPQHPYYFSALGQTDRVLVDVAATWITGQKFTKVGFIGLTDASGQLYQNEYKKVIASTKVQDAGQQVFSPSTTDITAQLTRLRSGGAQALYIGTSSSSIVTILTGMKQLGWNVPTIVGEGGVSSLTAKSISSLLPAAGVFGPGEAPEVFDQLPSDFPKPNADAAKKFAATWVTDLGNAPDWNAAAAYDCLNILLEASAKGGQGGDAMVKYMTSHTFTGALFNYKFTADDHRGSQYEGLLVRFTTDASKPFKFVDYYAGMKTFS